MFSFNKNRNCSKHKKRVFNRANPFIFHLAGYDSVNWCIYVIESLKRFDRFALYSGGMLAFATGGANRAEAERIEERVGLEKI